MLSSQSREGKCSLRQTPPNHKGPLEEDEQGLLLLCSMDLLDCILRHTMYREAGMLSASCKKLGASVRCQRDQ